MPNKLNFDNKREISFKQKRNSWYGVEFGGKNLCNFLDALASLAFKLSVSE